MNLNNTVTHCIAAESKGSPHHICRLFIMKYSSSVGLILFIYLLSHCSTGIKFQAAKLQRDIILYSWLFDCCSHKKLLPLKPKLVVQLKLSFILHMKYVSGM